MVEAVCRNLPANCQICLSRIDLDFVRCCFGRVWCCWGTTHFPRDKFKNAFGHFAFFAYPHLVVCRCFREEAKREQGPLRIKSIGPFTNPAGDSFCPIDSSNCSLCSSLLMICVVSAVTCIALYPITPPQSIQTIYLQVLFTILTCSGAKRPLWVRQ